MIHCRSYVAAEMGLFLKNRLGTKFLFDMRGFWADEKVDNDQWNQNNYLYRLIYKHYKKKEREFLLKADGIITLTQASKDYLISKQEYKNLSIEVIPCCADFNHFDFHKVSSEEIQSLKRKLQIPGTAKVITYLGSVGGWYMTHEMLSFFKMLTTHALNTSCLFLQRIMPREWNPKFCPWGYPRIKFLLLTPIVNILPQFMALSNCSVFFIKSSFSKMASSPTKHAELMGMGIPVICNDIGDTGGIINDTKTGFIINTFNAGFLSGCHP